MEVVQALPVLAASLSTYFRNCLYCESFATFVTLDTGVLFVKLYQSFVAGLVNLFNLEKKIDTWKYIFRVIFVIIKRHIFKQRIIFCTYVFGKSLLFSLCPGRY